MFSGLKEISALIRVCITQMSCKIIMTSCYVCYHSLYFHSHYLCKPQYEKIHVLSYASCFIFVFCIHVFIPLNKFF